MRNKAEIRLDAIVSNSRKIRKALNKDVRYMAVVKADAYGHGAKQVSEALNDDGITDFAVATAAEGVELRIAGIVGNILVLGRTEPKEVQLLVKYSLTQTVDSAAYARSLAPSERINVHIKVDTGMTRLGIYCRSDDDIYSAINETRRIYHVNRINVSGIFTHFAMADESEEATRKQFFAFKNYCNAVKDAGLYTGTCHCCNSAATINYPYMHFEMIRAGIYQYGYTPGYIRSDIKLTPAMKFSAYISKIFLINPGDTIGYGQTYKADTKRKIAVISVGYADGLHRTLSGKFSFVINGHFAPQVGRICMDMCMADVTGISCVEGDEAEIFGCKASLDALSETAGTIPYELLCSVSKRVPRIFV